MTLVLLGMASHTDISSKSDDWSGPYVTMHYDIQGRGVERRGYNRRGRGEEWIREVKDFVGRGIETAYIILFCIHDVY